MKGRGRFLFFVAAVLVLGGAAAVRWQQPIYAKFYVHRLEAAGVGADAAVGMAKELLALDPAERRVADMTPRARVRYRVATGFEFHETARRTIPAAGDESELRGAVEQATARALRLTAEVERDVKTPEGRDAAEGLLAGASAADVRKRAATALGFAGPEALPALRRAFDDPSAEVANYAFVAARPLAGPAESEALVEAAIASKNLRTRGFAAAAQEPKPVAIRHFIAALERTDLTDRDRTAIGEQLHLLTGETFGADAAAWKSWSSGKQ